MSNLPLLVDSEIIGGRGPELTAHRNVRHVVHKEFDVNYGIVFDCTLGTFYDQFKNVKINQGKSAPKVTLTQQVKRQQITEDFWQHFKVVSYTEWCGIDYINFLNADK